MQYRNILVEIQWSECEPKTRATSQFDSGDKSFLPNVFSRGSFDLSPLSYCEVKGEGSEANLEILHSLKRLITSKKLNSN